MLFVVCLFLFLGVVSGWVELKRLGVFTYLSVVPALSIVSALIAFAFPALFWPLFVMKVLEMMASYSLNQTGLQILYNPIPTKVRGSVRAVIDGAVKKLGGAVGGVVLLLVGASLAEEVLLSVVIIVGCLLLIWIMLLRPRYLDALRFKLGNRGVGPIPVIDPGDNETRNHLINALEDDDGATTLSATRGRRARGSRAWRTRPPSRRAACARLVPLC